MLRFPLLFFISLTLSGLPVRAQSSGTSTNMLALPQNQNANQGAGENSTVESEQPRIHQPYGLEELSSPLNSFETLPTPKMTAADESDADPLTLTKLEQLALSNNPTLVQAYARVQASRGDFVQSGLKPNPVVGYVANEMGNQGAAGQQGAYVSQRFVTANKLDLNRQVASREVARRKQLWSAQRQRVLTDLRLAYYRALIAQSRVETTRALVKVSDELVNRAESLLKSQEGSEVNLLQATTEAQTIRLKEIAAQTGLDVTWRQLIAVLGLPGFERRPLAGDPMAQMPTIDWDQSLQRLAAGSPELAAAAVNIQRARWAITRARAGRFPDVTGQVAVQHDDATDFTITSMQVGVPLPIFDRNQGNVVKACAQLREARKDLDRVQLQLINRLSEVYGRYAAAQKQTELYAASILPNARKALELVEVGYREGEIDYLTVLTAQRTFFQTSLAHLDAIQTAREAAVEIEGFLLTGSLQLP